MRFPAFPLALVPLLFLVLLLPCSEAAKKKTKPKGLEEEGALPGGRPALGSGELSTKEGHRCTWEAQEGRNNNIQLQVSCSIPGEAEGAKPSYACQFSGKPQECPAYVDKPAQYWKQVVGKLKKRTNACEGEKLLKTRLCKKGPAASHMKLAERKGEGQSERKKGGNKDGEKEKEKQAKEEMRRMEQEEEEEPMQGDSQDSYGETSHGAAESYCGEGWHSVCRFFTKLLDG